MWIDPVCVPENRALQVSIPSIKNGIVMCFGGFLGICAESRQRANQ
jgi:hypothetical protein